MCILFNLTSTQPAVSALAAVNIDSGGVERHEQGLMLVVGAAVCSSEPKSSCCEAEVLLSLVRSEIEKERCKADDEEYIRTNYR